MLKKEYDIIVIHIPQVLVEVSCLVSIPHDKENVVLLLGKMQGNRTLRKTAYSRLAYIVFL